MTIAANEFALPRVTTFEPAAQPAVPLRTRCAGYAVDMVIFMAVAMLVGTAVGAGFLVVTSGGTQEASDAVFYASFLGLAVGVPFVWTLLNVVLLLTRGQTGGQYVAGLRIVREDGAPMTPRTALGWWFALNPLFFSWPMLAVTVAPLTVVVFLSLQVAAYFIMIFLAMLFVAAPVVALVSALRDPQNRTLYDRVASVVATPLE